MTSAWWILQLFYCEIPFLISAIAATTTSHLTNRKPNQTKNDVSISFCRRPTNSVTKSKQNRINFYSDYSSIYIYFFRVVFSVLFWFFFSFARFVEFSVCGHRQQVWLSFSQTHKSQKKKFLFFRFQCSERVARVAFASCKLTLPRLIHSIFSEVFLWTIEI